VIQARLVYAGERLAFTVLVFVTITRGLIGAWIGVVALLNIALRVKATDASI